jgi:hypothetical protein
MDVITESVVEQAALAWLEAIGWRIAHEPDISRCREQALPTPGYRAVRERPAAGGAGAQERGQ